MLKFNASSYTIMFRCTSRILWQLNASLVTTATETNPQYINNSVKLDRRLMEKLPHIANTKEFNNLKKELCISLRLTSPVTLKVRSAENLQNLLKIITPVLSKTDITQAMNIITMWANKNNKSELCTEADYKLTRSVDNNAKNDTNILTSTTQDFSQYANLSTSEMIKVIQKLTTEGNRDVPLLKYLYNQIVMYNERLHMATCSSLMYYMSRLNYADERLLEKIWKDTVNYLDTTSNSISPSKLVSIVKSMSVIKYKNTYLLKEFCLQIIKYRALYNSTNVANILMSFATLGYHSAHVDELLMLYLPQMEFEELKSVAWLNVVWALTVFKKADESHIASILNEKFVQSVLLPGPIKMSPHVLKLLNINGYAQCVLNTCSAPSLIGSEMIPYAVCKRSKRKEMYVDALEVTLKTVFPSTSHYEMNVNSEMGFLIDAVLNINVNCTPTNQETSKNEKSLQIAVLIIDYNDFCLGSKEYTGIIQLYIDLLCHKNYEVLCIPYHNFGVEDKVEKRAKYIKQELLKKYKTSF